MNKPNGFAWLIEGTTIKLRWRELPPSRSQKLVYKIRRHPSTDDAGRIAGDYRVGRDILRYYGMSPNNRASADRNAGTKKSTHADPNVVLYDRFSRGRVCNALPVTNYGSPAWAYILHR